MSAERILVKRGFYCAKCGNEFSKGSSWRKHMMNQHGDRAEWKCENCKKNFGMNHGLKEHDRELSNH